MVRWSWVNFQYQGVLLVWIRVGQGPTALAVGAGGVVWTFYSHLSFLSSFSLSLGDDPIETEILPQRVVKPQNNQPTTKSLIILTIFETCGCFVSFKQSL